MPLAGSGTDSASNRALQTLREKVLPRALGEVDGIEYAVNGRTAFAKDFTDQVSDRTPVVFASVLVVAFVLLAHRLQVGCDPLPGRRDRPPR